jgi:hypothetical protein
LPLVELPKFTRDEKDIHRVHRAIEEKKAARVQLRQPVVERKVIREQRQQPALEEKKVIREQRQQPAVEKKAARVQLRQPAVEKKKAARDQRQQPGVEEEKAAREQRRRFRRSEDFLGVQGANPVTGMWDISDYTSTTEQMSAETQKRVDDQAKGLAEAQRRYEEALRDEKEEEKEQKRLAEKIKRRRGERWRLTENGWSTDLSPIVQSPCTPTAGEYI